MIKNMIAVAALCLCIYTASGYAQSDNASQDRGALNSVSAEMILGAAGLITEGKVYSLAIPTGPDTPAYGTRRYQVLTDRIVDPVSGNSVRGTNRLEGFDDYVTAWLGVGTQIDGFGHVSVEGRHYGGLASREVIDPHGAMRFGMETLPPIVGRGVLLDIAGLLGVERMQGGQVITPSHIMAAQQRQRVEIQAGDIVIFHTGWLSMAEEDGDTFIQTEPGIGVAAAEYLVDRGVIAVGADNWALDAIPAEDPEQFLPVHGFLLAGNGVHILENIVTQELADDGAYEFFFALAAPKLVGAVQSPVHPIAIR